MRKFLWILCLISGMVFGQCVVEMKMSGKGIREFQASAQYQYYVEIDERFVPMEQAVGLRQDREYLVQMVPAVDYRDYNQKYLQYYDYPRLLNYLGEMALTFDRREYQLDVIGKSVEGRDLFVLFPKNIDKDKKTVIMFCRHHGDEGTANWIVEGFLNEVFAENSDWLDQFQLILYPMVNPDGAENHTRHNVNGKDLNRTWKMENADEVNFIRGHLLALKTQFEKVVVVLDMHGSFSEDFIYRVYQSYAGQEYYDMQSSFINHLGKYDPWQNSTFHPSNGHPGMSRIFLVDNYRYNAMTHETIRNIPLNNNKGRVLDSLKQQGKAAYRTIQELYAR